MDQRKNYFDKLFKINVPHILEKIFFSLEYKSFKNCLEVNNGWNELLTSEAYKKKGKRTFNKEIGEEMWNEVYNDNAKEVKRLFSSGMVDINMKKVNRLGEDITLLYGAAECGLRDVAKVLLDAGVDPNKGKHNGETPLHIAVRYGHTDVVKILINGGADINKLYQYSYITQPPYEVTPLHLAAAKESTDMIKLLLDAGAEVDKADNRGSTALHCAARRDHNDVAKHLIDAGADFNKADSRGLTPLHQAASQGCTDAVKLLLQVGANPTVTSNAGLTPLHFAINRKFKEIVDILNNIG